MTEKTLLDASKGEYTFEVGLASSKQDIAKAVKEIFNVDVKRVKTQVLKGRSNRNLKGRNRVLASPMKKAMVTLGKEQKIDVFEAKQ